MEKLGQLFDRQKWLKYVIDLVAGLLLVVGGIVATSAPGWGILISLVGLAVIAIVTYVNDRHAVREDARRTLRQFLSRLLSQLEDTVNPDTWTLRANVMLVDKDAMRIAYPVGRYLAPELSVRWHRGQGCCGLAWEQGQTKFAPEDFDPPELPMDPDAVGPDRRWNMAMEQIEATRRITAVISVPLYRDDEQRIAGIFNVDDSRPLADSLLSDQRVQDAIEVFGRTILPPVIERAGRDIPKNVVSH